MNDSEEIYEDQDSDHLDPNIRAELRKSKERAKEVEEARAELDSLRRDLAFTKAGIPETGVGALLRKAYDGENDPEAIRKVADEYGIFNGQAGGSTDQVRDELERHRNIAGATGSNTSGPTPSQEFESMLDNASSADEIMDAIKRMGSEVGLNAPGMR